MSNISQGKAVAEEKMKEINVAYDYFEKKFNGN